jgi:hypothetical protein
MRIRIIILIKVIIEDRQAIINIRMIIGNMKLKIMKRIQITIEIMELIIKIKKIKKLMIIIIQEIIKSSKYI